MVGNAAEEGLLGQIDNPSHVDTGRITVPAAIVSGIVTGNLVWVFVPRSTVWLSIVLGALVCGVVAWRLARWFRLREQAETSAAHERRRAEQIAESQRQIAILKAKSR